MIQLIQRGGLPGLILGLAMIIACQWFNLVNGSIQIEENGLTLLFFGSRLTVPAWTLISISYLGAITMGGVVSSILNRNQFFEMRSSWTLIIAMCFMVVSSSVFVTPGLIVFSLILLLIYHRLFGVTDETMGELQLYMDLGTMFGMAVLFYSPGLLLLPMILLVINQFAYIDINRILLFLLSALMIVLPTLVAAHYFVSPHWVSQLITPYTAIDIDLSGFAQPSFLYPLLTLLAAILVLYPTMSAELTYMQNHNRKIVNTFILHLIFGLITILLMSSNPEKHMLLASLPAITLIAFGSGRIKSRWMSTIYIIFLMFAWILIQWAYLR